MLNALGIMQHHDAITGTAKQKVANNYYELLNDTQAKNNMLFAQMMGMRAAEAGLSDELQWLPCNTDPDQITPVCGIEKEMLEKWFIAAYNPSTVNQTSFHISVAESGTYKVSTIKDAQWSEVDSDLLCYN